MKHSPHRAIVNVAAAVDGCTGLSHQCPTPTIKVERNDGGLLIFGVLIGSNCQLALLGFGFIFLFIGFILTVFAYRGPSEDEDPLEYENRLEVTNNVRILGPVCIMVGLMMLLAGVILKHLSRRAKIKQTRIGFYCPVHGDFYPLSPGINSKQFIFSENKPNRCKALTSCFKIHVQDVGIATRDENSLAGVLPQCPHSIDSNRSSFDSQHIFASQQSTFTIPSVIVSGYLSTGSEKETILNFGSIRSLSIPNDVACFPDRFISHSSPPTSPSSPMHTGCIMQKRLSCPILPEIGVVSPMRAADHRIIKRSPILSAAKPEIQVVRPAVSESTFAPKKLKPLTSSLSPGRTDGKDDDVKKRKTVSIVLPKIEVTSQYE